MRPEEGKLRIKILVGRSLLAAAALCSFAPAAASEPRVNLGFWRIANNDIVGDGHDRWRTASYQVSALWGPEWKTRPPGEFAALLEFRIATEIVAPRNLSAPTGGDRPLAGAVSLGIHTHYSSDLIDHRLGFDVFALGPQSGQIALLTSSHEGIRQPMPSGAVLAGELPNAIHPTLSYEAARMIVPVPLVSTRPFVEAAFGLESYARIGVDVFLGRGGRSALHIRDRVTGHLYRAAAQGEPGFALTLGADAAWIISSAYLPASRGVAASKLRHRARAGVHWHDSKGKTSFFGLTYLGKEFAGQPEGQVLGSLRVNFRF